jgi:hypothetical protein
MSQFQPHGADKTAGQCRSLGLPSIVRSRASSGRRFECSPAAFGVPSGAHSCKDIAPLMYAVRVLLASAPQIAVHDARPRDVRMPQLQMWNDNAGQRLICCTE